MSLGVIARRVVLWPWQIPPANDGLQVVAVANPALETVWVQGPDGAPSPASPQDSHGTVVGYDLIVRVIESIPAEARREGYAMSPRAPLGEGAIAIDAWPLAEVDVRDPRLVVMKNGRGIRLPSISHLRRVRLGADGSFLEAGPVVLPETGRYEVSGKEDPSVTWMDGKPYLSYVGVSDWGITPVLARGEWVGDRWVYQRIAEAQGHHDNRDVKILPVRPQGKLWRHDRVNTLPWGPKRMTWATSPDGGISWSGSAPLLEGRFEWERNHVGAGAVPFQAVGPKGEPVLASYYHGVRPHPEAVAGVYQTGLALFDADRPDRLLGRLANPAVTAWEDADFASARRAASPLDEQAFTALHGGFVIPRVVFTTGHTRVGDRQHLFSGVNDFCIELAELPSLEECLATGGYDPEPAS
jgi:predicted GH43/DUF377 family glycosyl hydrolase